MIWESFDGGLTSLREFMAVIWMFPATSLIFIRILYIDDKKWQVITQVLDKGRTELIRLILDEGIFFYYLMSFRNPHLTFPKLLILLLFHPN